MAAIAATALDEATRVGRSVVMSLQQLPQVFEPSYTIEDDTSSTYLYVHIHCFIVDGAAAEYTGASFGVTWVSVCKGSTRAPRHGIGACIEKENRDPEKTDKMIKALYTGVLEGIYGKGRVRA